eukprot:CAMPEP_0171137508 /NCGR_PEP_ID=MMETSP0766_2-20121228/133483_1 /TAXON_ID=439317 /ORGANISM="Gambierdiscus australes, Strain CAWD 149" /LENGTH=268 /DNA_ID=CAMNT_0011601089 /DNA_START=41 /DNA_END=845 /DNA_ORIENTATION=+
MTRALTTRRNMGPATYFAAVTVRINSYQNRQGRWAQILNMSTRRERNGFGTMLIAGLEELLRAEDIDVVVLYPAENGRAPAFWSSLGFGSREVSHLPDEELVPHDQGGPLLPEFDTGSLVVLPRWEKRIGGAFEGAAEDAPSADAGAGCSSQRPAKRGRGGRRRTAGSHRMLPPSKSRVRGEPLLRAHEALMALRSRHKALLPPVAPASGELGAPEAKAALQDERVRCAPVRQDRAALEALREQIHAESCQLQLQHLSLDSEQLLFLE